MDQADCLLDVVIAEAETKFCVSEVKSARTRHNSSLHAAPNWSWLDVLSLQNRGAIRSKPRGPGLSMKSWWIQLTSIIGSQPSWRWRVTRCDSPHRTTYDDLGYVVTV